MSVKEVVPSLEDADNQTDVHTKRIEAKGRRPKVFEVESGDHLYKAALAISKVGLANYIQQNRPSAPLRHSALSDRSRAPRFSR